MNTKKFIAEFKKFRKQMSKASGFGFAFGMTKEQLEIEICYTFQATPPETTAARVARVAVANAWLNRACRLGGAA